MEPNSRKTSVSSLCSAAPPGSRSSWLLGLALACCSGLALAADGPQAAAAPAPTAASSASSPAPPASAAANTEAQPSRLQAQLNRIRTLQQQRPADGLLVYYEALTLAQMHESQAAVDRLATLQGKRLGLVPTAGIGFEPIWDLPAFQQLRQRLSDDEERVANAPVLLRQPDARLIPEGIAYDARRKLHYLGSVAQHKVIAVDQRGRVFQVSAPEDRLDAVLGLAVDARRDWLCAVSTNGFEASGEKQLRNAVLCWQLGGKKRLAARVEIPAAKQLNDLAFAPDGSLYISDSAEGSLWHWQPSSGLAPQRVGEAGGLRGANGVAVSGDGKTVYVTLSTGIARVEPKTGEAQRMPQPEPLVTGGIDGLYWHQGGLVGVQNSPNPGRVIRLLVTDDGTRIEALTVLQSHHHPEFAEPTTGVVVGNSLHVIANSHVGRYQPDGRLEKPETLRPTAIVAVPLKR